jgi:hypothetical protein
MSPTPSVREILESVAARMLADFNASRQIEHRGSKGTVRESGLRTAFLEKYLPGQVAVVGSGEVIATNGQVSGQCDVMIVDPATPPWWDEKDYRIAPAECVDAVIEVKSNLTVAELRSAWASIRRVKALPKTAYRAPDLISHTTNLYGRSWEHWPTLGFVFAYEGAAIDTLAEEFAKLARDEPDAALRVDGVFVLNRGSVLWYQNDFGLYSAHGRPGDPVVATTGSPTEVLMSMLGHFNVLFSQVNRRVFDALPYLTGGLGTSSSIWPTA